MEILFNSVIKTGCHRQRTRHLKVVATDIYRSRKMAGKADIAFCESSIQALSFAGDTFDIIFSSHVIKHIPQSKEDCLFVFSVPTNIWLLLSLPAKYLGKLNSLMNCSTATGTGSRSGMIAEGMDIEKRTAMEKQLSGKVQEKTSLLNALLPKGHGVYSQFNDCFKAFTIKAWADFFRKAGFSVHKTVPLLLYGPSERPIISTSSLFGRYGICSSVLFIMGKKVSGSVSSRLTDHVS